MKTNQQPPISMTTKLSAAALAALALTLLAATVFSASPKGETFAVSIVKNPTLEAAFHRKEKTKNRGWKVYIRFTNKSDTPIRSIGTHYEMREGDWRVSDNSTWTSSTTPLLKPKESAVFGWIDEVPSSVDHIHIARVETK